MRVLGEMRVYVGGHWREAWNGEEWVQSWHRGKKVGVHRYCNRWDRCKQIERYKESFLDEHIEIIIFPDDQFE